MSRLASVVSRASVVIPTALLLSATAGIGMLGVARAQVGEPEAAEDLHDGHEGHEHGGEAGAGEQSALTGGEEHDHPHGRGTDAHSHEHLMEIALSPGLAFLVLESELAFSLHLHALVAIPDTRWALGLGVERLFGDHGHTTISVVVEMRIIAGWIVSVAGGITLEDAEPSHVAPSGHLETAYEIGVGPFHIGPSLELAVDPEDIHVTLGFHLGVGF